MELFETWECFNRLLICFIPPQEEVLQSKSRGFHGFPLPVDHEHVDLARQAMFLRNTTMSTLSLMPVSVDMTLYTDGSCDDTRDPFTARAAWAVTRGVIKS